MNPGMRTRIRVGQVALLGLAAILFSLASCTREITGDVELADNSSDDCFTCHSDLNTAVTNARYQFENSFHGSGENTNRNRLYQASYQSCERCHTNEGYIGYVDSTTITGDAFTAIGCFTCHSPHSNGDFTLRQLETVKLMNGYTVDLGKGNLCATCHMSRRDVTTFVVAGVKPSGTWGPHYGNQSDMFVGQNAYQYAGYNYTRSWHATGVTDGCVSCHMSPSFHESIGGHSWNMRNEERNFQNLTGCNVTGCHNSAPITALNRLADADHDWDGTIEGVETEITGLLDSLHDLLVIGNLADTLGVPKNRVISTADSAGALYNFLFVEDDRSLGVHNTDYAVGLLRSSINFLAKGNPNGVPEQPVLLSSH